MSAEAGTEPEAPKRRGRIPQSAWPHILERHRAGATLSAIAREFDCTPSAISYIVRKAEASGIEPAAAPAAEPAESSETVTESVAESAEPAQPERRNRISRKRRPAPLNRLWKPALPAAYAQPAVEQPAVVEQAPEPRPVPKRPAPQEGRPQLRASDLGRGSAQAAAREPVPLRLRRHRSKLAPLRRLRLRLRPWKRLAPQRRRPAGRSPLLRWMPSKGGCVIPRGPVLSLIGAGSRLPVRTAFRLFTMLFMNCARLWPESKSTCRPADVMSR